MKRVIEKDRFGVVLLITLIVLVVLASIGYTLTTRIAAQRHRDQYIIDYQNARYACDSGIKYVLATLDSVQIKLIDRPNEPDFSDVFNFTDEQYKTFLAQWIAAHPREDSYDSQMQTQDVNDVNTVPRNSSSMINVSELSRLIKDSNSSSNDSNLANLLQKFGDMNDSNYADWQKDPNKLPIPGPYGPPWPLVTEPVEFQIGNSNVTIEIEDENAKLPLIWGANTDKDKQQEVDAAITTFGEWMNMSYSQIDTLKSELKSIGEIKPFNAATMSTAVVGGTAGKADANGSTNPNAVRSRLSRAARQRQAQQQQQQQQQQMATSVVSNPAGEFVRLLNSSKLDTEAFAVPYIKTEQRTESILKYMSRWGATRVNVNSAPRNVLEAAFMFGGDAPKVADAIIKERQQKPFKDVNDLQKRVYKYSDSILKSKDAITGTSNVFSVKITAICGVAKATATAVVMMEGKKAKVIAIIVE
jgi:hypothetical protein